MKRKIWVLRVSRTRGPANFRGRPSGQGHDEGVPGVLPWKTLVCHPSCQGSGNWRLQVKPSWCGDGALQLDYHLRVPRRALAMPPQTNPGRQDDLWRHSCCEAFIGLPGEAAYLEFNFSPSGAWALYGFANERVPLPLPRLTGLTKPPEVHCDRRRHAWRLRARIPPDLLPSRKRDQILLLGLAVVAEDRQGGLSYWALHHPRPQPNFHHPGGRILTWSGPLHQLRDGHEERS